VLGTSLNGSSNKVMSGCIIERWCETETQDAVEVAKVQESIGSLRDAILLEWVRIATEHNALMAHSNFLQGKSEKTSRRYRWVTSPVEFGCGEKLCRVETLRAAVVRNKTT